MITSEDGPLARDARDAGRLWLLCPRRSPLGYLFRLARLLRRLRPQVAHAHSGRLACLAARLAGVPLILETRHGVFEQNRPLYRRFPALARWEGWKCRLAHRTLCVCAADARWLERAGGLPRRRLAVALNGVPPAGDGPSTAADARRVRRDARRREWDLPREEPILGFVGRLAGQKAPERVLELLARLAAGRNATGAAAADAEPRDGGPEGAATGPEGAAAGPDGAATVPLAVFCGDGPLQEELRRLADALGIAHRVRYLGEVPDARRILPAFDLLLLPSRFEGLPYAILEALAEGVPVLATPVAGVPEALSGPVLSASVLAWDPQDWAQRARTLLRAPAAERWREAAAARAASLTEDRMLAEIAAVYGAPPAGVAEKPAF